MGDSMIVTLTLILDSNKKEKRKRKVNLKKKLAFRLHMSDISLNAKTKAYSCIEL